MAINLHIAAQYIHGASPGSLDGLYQAVEAKCKELGLEPGRRDNVGVGEGGSPPNINVRGLLTFVDGVRPLPETPAEDAEAIAADQPQPTDSTDELLAKRQRNDHRRANKETREREIEQTKADHDSLRKLYGTLKAKFASAGYSPKPVGGALS